MARYRRKGKGSILSFLMIFFCILLIISYFNSCSGETTSNSETNGKTEPNGKTETTGKPEASNNPEKVTCPFSAGFDHTTIKNKTYYLLDYENKIMVYYSKGSNHYTEYTIAGTISSGVYITNLETWERSDYYYKEGKVNGSKYVIRYKSDGSYNEYDTYSIMSDGDISTAWSQLIKNTDYLEKHKAVSGDS